LEALTIDSSFVVKAIPAKRQDAHKGMNGSVCIVGGSRLYHGAPFLAASGAIRAGVDLVYLAVPETVSTPIRSLSPDFIVLPLPDAKLTRGNVSRLRRWLPKVDCVAMGPGMGPQNPEDIANAVNLLKEGTRGVVLDADALRQGVLEAARAARAVVTPHAGEFERLFSVRAPEKIDERSKVAAAQAKAGGVTVLLKGPIDVITDGARVALNKTHSPAMTVGGTGDILTGVTAGLIARGVPIFEAACSAAYVNGAAGAEAAQQMGLHITASDVVKNIPFVMKKFDRLV
jgi:NAD(P)H-hydrate epimerase